MVSGVLLVCSTTADHSTLHHWLSRREQPGLPGSERSEPPPWSFGEMARGTHRTHDVSAYEMQCRTEFMLPMHREADAVQREVGERDDHDYYAYNE